MQIRKRILAVLIILAVMLAQTACTARQSDPGTNQPGQAPADNQSTEDQAITMAEFQKLTEEPARVEEIVSFVNRHIASLSRENASQMVILLEKTQQDYLPQIEEKYNDTVVQQKFFQEYQPGVPLNDPEGFQDQELKDLVSQPNQGQRFQGGNSRGHVFPCNRL